MPSKRADDSPVFQLKVTLKYSKPPIWRRIQVRGSATLARLHLILQVAMGWTDSHLHVFDVGGVPYGMPDPEWEAKDERRVKLGQVVAQPKDRLTYLYDMGDNWTHEIVVEKVLPPEPGVRYPICLAGRRACPPEDIGGMWGYEGFLEALRDPNHEEHESLLEWVGGDFNPATFNLEPVNRELKRL
jgi:hypothetical protein